MKFLEMKALDGSPIRVSRIAIGSAMSMGALKKEQIFAVYDAYCALGGNCIDTARYYNQGMAEQTVGEWLQSRGCRGQIVLSSKGGHPADEAPEVSRLTKKDLLADLEASLCALGTDYIDLYWIHKDDPHKSPEEIAETAHAVVQTGKVRCIGCSNFHTDRIAAVNACAEKNGWGGFACSQLQWSLTATKEEYFRQFGAVVMDDASYAWYYGRQMPVFCFSSQAQGFFARAAAGGLDSLPPHLQRFYGSPENMLRLEKVRQYAAQHHVPVSAPVLGYLVDNKLPAVALIGAENVEMLRQSMCGGDLEMTPAEADALYQV